MKFDKTLNEMMTYGQVAINYSKIKDAYKEHGSGDSALSYVKDMIASSNSGYDGTTDKRKAADEAYLKSRIDPETGKPIGRDPFCKLLLSAVDEIRLGIAAENTEEKMRTERMRAELAARRAKSNEIIP